MSATPTAAARSAATAAAPTPRRKFKPLSPEAYADLRACRDRWNEVLNLVNDLIADIEDGHVSEHLPVDIRDDIYGSLNEVWGILANNGPKVRRYQR